MEPDLFCEPRRSLEGRKDRPLWIFVDLWIPTDNTGRSRYHLLEDETRTKLSSLFLSVRKGFVLIECTCCKGN